MESNEFASGLAEFLNEADNAHQTKKFKTKEEKLAPYFVPRNATEIFRIFPDKQNNFYAIAHFHYIKVGNRYQKLYCPKHNDGTDCALCNVVDKLTALENQDVKKKVFNKQPLTEAEKAIADKNSKIYKEKTKWIAAKYYILRGVDKQQLKDGIKFWRFKFHKKKEGPMDKLSPVLKQYKQFMGHDPLDKKMGADLILTTADLAMPNNPTRTYKAVTAINYRGPIAAVEDQLILDKLEADQLSWKEVFVKKNPPHITYEEYLTLIPQNKAPYYDDSDPKNKKWIYPGNPELELKANTRTAGQAPTNDDFDEDDEEMTTSSYTSQQINQHKGVDVTSTATSGALIDQMLSNQTTAPSTPTVQPGNIDVSDDLLSSLPF